MSLAADLNGRMGRLLRLKARMGRLLRPEVRVGRLLRLKVRVGQPLRLSGPIGRLAAGGHLSHRAARARLTLLYGGLFLLSGAALVAITYGLFQQATQYTKPHLPNIPHAPAVQRLKLLPPAPAFLPQLARDQYQLSQDQHQLEQVNQPSGTAVTRLQFSVPQLVRDQHRLAQDQHQLAHAVGQLVRAVHQVAQTGAVEAAQRAADSHELLVNSGVALAIVAVLALLAGWLLAGRVLQPLEDSYLAQRQFVANASHELRAPLARQRALIQVALADQEADLASLRAAHERVLASERHLEQMIDGLLALTRGQAGLERRERLDLAPLAEQALRTREAEIAHLGLDVKVALAPAPTSGDARLLERMIANLLDNAIRHNLARGHVELATGIRHQRAFLMIANSGPAIPSGEVPRLMQPFQRLHGTRTTHANGSGLGLAIVGAIAAAHRAVLTVKPRRGGGLTLEVALSATPGDPERADGIPRRAPQRAGARS